MAFDLEHMAIVRELAGHNLVNPNISQEGTLFKATAEQRAMIDAAQKQLLKSLAAYRAQTKPIDYVQTSPIFSAIERLVSAYQEANIPEQNARLLIDAAMESNLTSNSMLPIPSSASADQGALIQSSQKQLFSILKTPGIKAHISSILHNMELLETAYKEAGFDPKRSHLLAQMDAQAIEKVVQASPGWVRIAKGVNRNNDNASGFQLGA